MSRLSIGCAKVAATSLRRCTRGGVIVINSPLNLQCLLCTACPACDVVLLNALLCVHGAHAWILSCGVLLMLACLCRFSLTTLSGLHVPMLFEWCVQAFPSGHVGPPATAGNKRGVGKGLH